MTIEIDKLKKHLQRHMTDGLVTLVGSGLSSAVGLPTMSELAKHLTKEMPSHLVGNTNAETEWQKISEELATGTALETALKNVLPENELILHIVELTANFILSSEQQVIQKIFDGKEQLAFSRLIRHIIVSNEKHVVVTTNYDRLIELAAEISGYGVDTLFDGRNYGKLDKVASRNSLNIAVVMQTRAAGVKLKSRPHIVVLKPHGSLDWYANGESPVRLSIPISAQRMMIIPGGHKYRGGYDSPFDVHRAEANAAIDKATRYLVLGYGFNDDHLETHLRQELKKGKPCVILTRDLTENTISLLECCPKIMAISQYKSAETVGTQVRYENNTYTYPNMGFWDLDNFVTEVLEP